MKILIWDFDGTLAFRAGMWSGTLFEILQDHSPGHRWTVDHIRPHLQSGFPWNDWNVVRSPMEHSDDWWLRMNSVFTTAFMTGCAYDQATATRLAGFVRPYYVNPERWKLFPDSVPALTLLARSGWTHVLLSNHVPELEQIMKHLGIHHYFRCIFNSAVTGVEKPNSCAFQAALATMGESEIAVMIGDSLSADIEGARSVNIPGILVRKGRDSKWSCENLDALPGILQEILDSR